MNFRSFHSGAMTVAALSSMIAFGGFGCEDESTASQERQEGRQDGTQDRAPGTTPPNRGVAPPVITVDLEKIASDLGAGYHARADGVSMMAQGKTLDAKASTAYFDSQMTVARISKELSDMLQKNPRWQASLTRALEKNAKAGIIALYHAENALKKAQKSGKVGTTTGQCPADIKKFVADNSLIIDRIRGLMPYSKAEMDPAKAQGAAAKK